MKRASAPVVSFLSSAAVFLFIGSLPRVAAADEPVPAPAPPESALPPDPTPLAPFPPPEPEAPAVKVTPIGYIEAYYAWNFNDPVNNITNYRAFDNRHNTITINNAALGATLESGPVSGRLMLQIGNQPSSVYASEPVHPGTPVANASGPELWKYIQEAYVTYKAPVGRGLTLKAGIEGSPCGLETFAVHDNWNWSRSNLFAGLPFYHTGLRATYDLTDRLSASVAVLNGWNSVVDNNDGKTVEGHVTYRIPDKASLQVLYMGGVERASNAPEGQYWRHHFDATGELTVTSWLRLAAEADYGFEPNRIGTARWFAGAAYARAKALSWLYFAVRGDRFYEHLATDATGRASTPLFWNGVEWVSSATATAEVRPHDHISIRLEFRHDQADGLLYFTGDTLNGNGSASSPYLPNARRQETLLLGATAWF
jgi:hypothetical protein